ncbi:hypothetical protein [Acanthopleuribacter pedis]|uniref:HPr kinase n=1 Tax=Acanthopleuribacter pedis TaxID=442870 RepID=A0A8J7U236_9BACT|nr:hypothetical protein [Acanthopleuribacter pedis]
MSDGTPQLKLSRTTNGYVLRVARVGFFSIAPQGIGVFHNGDVSPVPYLLGRVFTLWLELFHMPVLHGATLHIHGTARGFLGHSGAGKSTLTGYLNTRDIPLVTDDLIPLEDQNGTFIVQPGIPCSRMWPAFGREFYGASFDDFPRVHPEIDKRRIPRIVAGRDRFVTNAVPLTHLYILERDEHQPEPQISRLPPAQALVHLAHLSSIHLEIKALGLQSTRLMTLAKLVERTQVNRLRYGNGLATLEHIAQLLTHSSTQSATPPGG